MRVADFSFDLPEELIARYPKTDRTASRLLAMSGNNGAIEDLGFVNIIDQLNVGDLLVFNNKFVIYFVKIKFGNNVFNTCYNYNI